MYGYSQYLAHHGVKGMKWGVRRYQNADGTLTDAGKRRMYKDIKQYSNSKDKRKALGAAVGEHDGITSAARKAVSASKKLDELISRRNTLAQKMESEYFKERDRLEREDSIAPNQREKAANKLIRDKYGKESDVINETLNRAHDDYNKTLKSIADDYLGKYGDKPVNGNTTASEALMTQIDWGIHLDRLGNYRR